MKSYAVIDRIERNFAVCEVELIETQESNSEDYFNHETIMIDIPMILIKENVSEVMETDILIVEHDGDFVIYVYEKSEQEKQRRIAIFKEIMNS